MTNMKNLLFVLLACLALSGCGLKNAAEAEDRTPNTGIIEPAESKEGKVAHAEAATFRDMMEKNETVQLVDVRTGGEFAAGHLQGSTHIDISSDTFDKAAQQLDPEVPVFVYCAMGGRSRTAADRLKAMGYQVVNLQGGITGWQSAGFDVVK